MYSIISLDQTYDGQAIFMEFGYNTDRIRVAGDAQSFARLCRMTGIREIKVYGTDNKPAKGGLCYTSMQACSFINDMITTLRNDKGMARGKKTTYTFEVIDPYTCAVLNTATVSI